MCFCHNHQRSYGKFTIRYLLSLKHLTLLTPFRNLYISFLQYHCICHCWLLPSRLPLILSKSSFLCHTFSPLFPWYEALPACGNSQVLSLAHILFSSVRSIFSFTYCKLNLGIFCPTSAFFPLFLFGQ